MNASKVRCLKVNRVERISTPTPSVKKVTIGSDKNTLRVQFNRSVLLDVTAFTDRKRKAIIGVVCVLQRISFIRKIEVNHSLSRCWLPGYCQDL